MFCVTRRNDGSTFLTKIDGYRNIFIDKLHTNGNILW